MKKILLPLLMMVFVAFAANAQKPVTMISSPSNAQAKAVVDKAIVALQQAAYEGNYNFTVAGQDEKVRQTLKGQVKLWKEKFFISLAGTEMYYDGKTQWTYVKDLNEVSITEPTPMELAESSPLAMVKGYSKGHRVDFDETATDEKFYYVSVYPLNHGLDYFRVQLVISKKTYLVNRIKVSQRNGDRVTIALDALTPIAQPTVTMFTYSKEAHPKATVSDLR